MSGTIDFIKALFGITEHQVHFISLGNDRGGPLRPRMLSTRREEGLASIMTWDGPERGLYLCVGTLLPGKNREKANVKEIAFLHADIDFKDISDSQKDVERKLSQLRLPPSITVFSGHGIHAYWLLKEPMTGEFDRIEDAYKLLADLIGADTQVCHVAALMRLPGSHNTKQGAMTPVEVLTLNADRRYELDDIEEWLSETSPVILRNVRPQAVPEDNPFVRAAAALGFKPPIDVEKRLSAMMYMGGGDSGVHATQLAVSASLLNQGVPVEEVVKTLLEATRAAVGAYGERWNWHREETNIRKQCASWLKKHPREEPKVVPMPKPTPKQTLTREPDEGTSSGPGEVVSLAQARKDRQPKGKDEPKKKNVHVIIAKTVLDVMRERGEDLLIVDETLWRYRDSIWSSAGDGKAWLDAQAQTACEGLEIVPANKLVSEARQYILRNESLRRDAVSWDAHGKVPTRSGLIDPRTGKLEPALAAHHCTWRLDIDYDPTAACPWWLQMLEDVFADRDAETRAALIAAIQDCAGAGLIDNKPRALSRALLLIGGANAGKSGLLEVLGGMYGRDHIAVELDTIEGTHALMPFLRRRPWVLHEAFSGKKWHQSSTIKAIITGEPVNINPKNGAIVSRRVTAPIFWGTNHTSTISESTNAIAARILQVSCKREFIEGLPVGAAVEAFSRGMSKPSELVLAEELPGLLNWALAGLARALERGKIEVPQEVKDAAEEIRDDGNVVARFVKECCSFDPFVMVSAPDFSTAHAAWWAQEKGGPQFGGPTNDSIGRAIAALGDGRIASLRTNAFRCYPGIMLNTHGLNFHKIALETPTLEGRCIGATEAGGLVNKPIPSTWDTKPQIQAIRREFERRGRRDASLEITSQSVTEVSPDGDASSVTKTEASLEVSPLQAVEPKEKPRF